MEVEEDVLKANGTCGGCSSKGGCQGGCSKMDVDVQMDLVVVRINKKYILI